MAQNWDLKKFDSRSFPNQGALAKKIAFVQPKIPDGNYLPNLGIMILASLLIRDGFEVRIFDENISSDPYPDLLEFGPDLVGFTAVTAAVKSANQRALWIKEKLPGVVTMVGGPHVSAVPKETVQKFTGFDYGLAGEAEISLRKFLQLLLVDWNPSEARKVAGLVYLNEAGEPVANRAADFLEGKFLDELPFPAWHLLPMEEIFSKVTHGLFSRGKRIMPVMTTRGCPNYCGFCCRVMGFKFRKQEIERVLLEVQWLYDTYAIDEIYFEDDTFTQDPDRAHELLDGIINLNLPIYVKFANGLRADKVDESLLSKMKAAGVYWVGFGIESGSPHTQKLMRKFLDLELARKNVILAKCMGFKVGSNCIIGYPGETMGSIKESINYFLGLNLDSFAVVNCVPFPGTSAWQECEKNGWFTEHAKDYENYWFEVFKVTPLIETPTLSAKQLAKAIFLVYIRFYFLNPRRTLLVLRALSRKFFAKTQDLPMRRWVRVLRGGAISSPTRKAS